MQKLATDGDRASANNGDEDYPVHKTLKLSDAYKEKVKDISLELVVEVYNINKTKNNPLLEKCETLNQYSQFINIAKKFIKKVGI